MKMFLLGLTLCAATLFAQTTPPQTPPSGAQGQTGAGAATSQRPARRQQMQQMRQEHMQQMQQSLDQFRTLLDKLKADTAKIEDAAGKQVAQDNVDLWQAFYDHVQNMSEMMQQRGMGMGMGPGMHQHRMGNPPSTQPQPKTTPPPK